MVDASTLHDYEFALFVSSAFLTVCVAFSVEYIHASEPKIATYCMAIAIVFAVLTIFFFGWGISKRKKMTSHSKKFKMKAGLIEDVAITPVTPVHVDADESSGTE